MQPGCCLYRKEYYFQEHKEWLVFAAVTEVVKAEEHNRSTTATANV
jgi:hypothetical protein